MQFDYHPAFGLPDSYRAQILAYARITSVAQAAKHYNVAPCTIYAWRKAVIQNVVHPRRQT
jgi:hypothetical protein